MGNVFNSKVNPPLPTQYWIGLSSTSPNIAGAGVTEPSTIGTGYGRVQLTSLSEPSGGEITNSGAISFEESLTSWGVMTHYVIYDASIGGNLLMYGPLTISRAVEQNTVITIKSGELTIILENPSA
jgi:hypothetical protein